MKRERGIWVLGALSFAILHGCFGFFILAMALEGGNPTARTTQEQLLTLAIGLASIAALLLVVGAWMQWNARTMYALTGAIGVCWVLFYLIL